MSSEKANEYIPELPISLFVLSCQSVIKDYICPLCGGVIKDPVVDLCGHIFCKKCFNISYAKNQVCPITKEQLLSQPTNVIIIAQILEKQKLYCKNKDDGCEWEGSLRELDEHLNKYCSKQKVQCTNEGCNVELLREEIPNHLNVCLFKKESCDYCNAIMVVNEKEEHLKVCPKVEVLCDQNCGMKLPREELKIHKKDYCSYSILQCPYVEYGCDDKEIFRKDFNDKMDKDVGKHLLLLVNIIDKFGKKIENLQKEIQEQKAPENMKKIIDDYFKTNKNIPNTITLIPQEKNKSSQPINNNSITPGEGTLSSVKNDIQFITKKHERENNIESNESDNELDVPIVFTANPLSTPSKSISSTHSKDTPFFDIVNLKSSISIIGMVARFSSNTRPEHTFLFTSKNINTTTCADYPSWKIKILTSSLWLGFGLCDKKKVLSNRMRFISPRNDRTSYHGSYLISTNGYTWNCNNENENNRQIELPVIDKGTIVEIIYNKNAKELSFKIGESTIKLTKVCPIIEGNKMLTPCVVFLHTGNSVEFLDIKF